MLIFLAGEISLKQQGDTLTEGIEKSLIVTEYSVIFKEQGRFYCLNKSSFEGGGGRKQQISFCSTTPVKTSASNIRCIVT